MERNYLFSRNGTHITLINKNSNISISYDEKTDLLGSGTTNKVYQLTPNLVIKIKEIEYSKDDYEDILDECKQRSFLLKNDFIVDIYFYGKIFKKYCTKMYTIEKKIHTKKDIENPEEFFLKSMKLLSKIQNQGYIYRDFKLENIGFTKKDDKMDKVLIIDFDDITLFDKTMLDTNERLNEYLEYYDRVCGWVLTGTHVPLYIVKNNVDIIDQLDKLPVQGVVDMIFSLFFPDEIKLQSSLWCTDNTFSNLHKFVLPKKHLQLMNQIENIPRSKDLQKYIDIIKNLMSLKYEDIWTFQEIIEYIYLK